MYLADYMDQQYADRTLTLHTIKIINSKCMIVLPQGNEIKIV